ncbi:L-lactate permease [Halalkalibacterium halodurans]|jgi:lactate permease|uniref:L-lactate permease n=1 Tax=Halalkalibacterium halodurans TaxID=86665 RepID=A0A0M0KFA1_ALKHA|nr:L-lactate permease [Halalkalibacterium halodurans]MED3645795.1 L-lactate permease [Halalkalibacterium halodurans]MED4163954.1 L-lactate permease [Halalkalibacterium halodurans]TES56495.1 L-lactate permease [Halalkalibacterium halodurans]TPE69227.1 L-lactate permease [Halalkalibacterium halodurans]
MLVETYDPFQHLAVSAFVAAIPILLLLLCLTVFKMQGIQAALLTLLVTFFIAGLVFHLPFGESIGSIVQGVVQGLWPIGYIIVMAVWLYKIAVASGKFAVLRGSIIGISRDQRIQLLLIGFCFNAFLEGAAGFGVPIAICAVLLVSLGFKPLQAAMLCLIANGASGAFGAIGIPVGIIDTLGLEGQVTSMDVSMMTALTLPMINFTIPFLLIGLMDGWKGIKEILPAILVTSSVYTVSQALITIFIGPELADIIPSLLTMGLLALFLKRWQPRNIFLLNGNGCESEHASLKDVIKAWSPFYLLTMFVFLWSLPAFKGLFAEGGALEFSKWAFVVPGSSIEVGVDFIGATGTAILLAAVTTVTTTKTIRMKESISLLKKVIVDFSIPIMMICAIIGIAKLMTYGGLTMALGEAVATTGAFFPFLSPILGWIGVFMTGSVVNNNTLFAPIQTTAGSIIGTNPSLLVAANTAGGVMAKLVSPQSIAIATAAVGETGNEAALTKMTLKYSFGLLVFVSVWTYILSLLF